MSFMFKPYPYEDLSPINRPDIPSAAAAQIVSGTEEVCKTLSLLPLRHFESGNAEPYIFCMDGFIGTQWQDSVERIEKILKGAGVDVEIIDFQQVFKSPQEVEEMLQENLPQDREIDPILLFGKIFEGTYEDFFDARKFESLRTRLAEIKNSTGRQAVFVYGYGSAVMQLRPFYDAILYYDLTPYEMTLRINRGEVSNLGRADGHEYRRFYYVDFEVAYRLRDELLLDAVDYYIDGNKLDRLILLPKAAFDAVTSQLVKYPFRCKPIYMEGIWGGHFFKHLRNLPKEMKNCAWIFELIPNEVSILVEVGPHLLDIPFLTFVKKEGVALMGQEIVERFGGIFPVRFNYDDTYHSNGNMSIQVHPTSEYAAQTFNEQFQQDEAYYVVATGHEAKTYLGFKEEVNIDQFFSDVRESEETKRPVDYQKYIHSVPSKPGVQILLPAGTIHASGRNQVVLELGSCTMGSMTFKQYDYVRVDSNGNLRPIHINHGINVIQRHRRSKWVEEHLVPAPKLVEDGDGWKEFIVGEYETIFFSLRRLEFEKECNQDTRNEFHVLTLIDGENVLVQSLDNPKYCFEQRFLEIVVVPANIGRYVIKNLGTEPVRMHKVKLKD